MTRPGCSADSYGGGFHAAREGGVSFAGKRHNSADVISTTWSSSGGSDAPSPVIYGRTAKNRYYCLFD